jgi:predicted porin
MPTFIRTAAACVCLSALSLAPAVSQAASTPDSVQLYGIADMGFQFLGNGPGRTSSSGLFSGNMYGSRFGMRGSEDLGDGLRAIFNLEAGVDMTSGKSLQGSRLFGRQANVGLSSKEWGTLTLGRHNTLMIDWMSKFNPFDNANMSMKQVDPAFSDRMDNSAKYTVKLGDVTVGSYFSTGWNNDQTFGDNEKGRMFGFGVRYTANDLDAVLLWHSKHADAPKAGADSGNREDRAMAALSYDFGGVEVDGGFRWLKQTLTTRDYNSNMTWVGVAVRPTNAWKLSGAVYHLSGTVCDDMNNAVCPLVQGVGKDQKPSMVILGAEYYLSKRTELYSLASYSINNHGSSQSVVGGKYGVSVEPGANQLGVALGMVHRF